MDNSLYERILNLERRVEAIDLATVSRERKAVTPNLLLAVAAVAEQTGNDSAVSARPWEPRAFAILVLGCGGNPVDGAAVVFSTFFGDILSSQTTDSYGVAYYQAPVGTPTFIRCDIAATGYAPASNVALIGGSVKFFLNSFAPNAQPIYTTFQLFGDGVDYLCMGCDIITPISTVGFIDSNGRHAASFDPDGLSGAPFLGVGIPFGAWTASYASGGHSYFYAASFVTTFPLNSVVEDYRATPAFVCYIDGVMANQASFGSVPSGSCGDITYPISVAGLGLVTVEVKS